MTGGMVAIGKDEHAQRIARAQDFMREQGIAAIYLNAGANLSYFTGTKWYASERMVGAILPASGEIEYIAPAFEESTLPGFMLIEGKVNCWEEHESPYQLFVDVLARMGIAQDAAAPPRVGICESAAFFIYDGIRPLAAGYALENARAVTAYCRSRKSPAEIALMQRVMDMTLAVHVATASMLVEGITTVEVEEFIQRAHRKVGAPRSYFCIVLFGEATAYPHGVNYVQTLKAGDTVLIDTGCQVMNYISDITRTYVFGNISERQRIVWNSEKAAQAAAFAAAQRACPAGTWTAPRASRWKQTASAPATSCRACRTARATASASISTNGRTWWERHHAARRRHVLLERADDLHPRRIRHPSRGPFLHDGRAGFRRGGRSDDRS